MRRNRTYSSHVCVPTIKSNDNNNNNNDNKTLMSHARVRSNVSNESSLSFCFILINSVQHGVSNCYKKQYESKTTLCDLKDLIDL